MAGVAMIVLQVAIFTVWPPPDTAHGMFELLIENPLLGLIALDALYVVSNLLAYVLYFALAVVLWRVSRSGVVLALAFGVLGMAAYMASPRPVEMLQLAHSTRPPTQRGGRRCSPLVTACSRRGRARRSTPTTSSTWRRCSSWRCCCIAAQCSAGPRRGGGWQRQC